MIFDSFRSIWRPEAYHGSSRKKEYFEGWYYKIVDRDESNACAIIPGISYGKSECDSHSFVQFFNGAEGVCHYYRYAIDDFGFSKRDFEVTIGGNRFSADRLELDLEKTRKEIRGELEFENLHRWPVTSMSPSSMGKYAFVPFIECYHHVISLDHTIKGSLMIDSEDVGFTDGRGYTEKSWGRSFPSGWIWMQSNHFCEEGVSVLVSVVNTRWMRRSFLALICGLLLNGCLYRFCTYGGSKVENVKVSERKITVQVSSQRLRLELEATRSGGAELRAPVLGAMVGKTVESLTSRIWVRLSRKADGKAIFEGVGRNAGLEVGGDIIALDVS